MVCINGEQKTGYEDVNIETMVLREGYDKTRIAVEVNGVIVSKNNYDKTLLCDGDRVEVVSFVGGG